MKIADKVFQKLETDRSLAEFKRAFYQNDYRYEFDLSNRCSSPESAEAILRLCGDNLNLIKRCIRKFKAGYSESRVYMWLYDLGDKS